jgi:hypothetical protein
MGRASEFQLGVPRPDIARFPRGERRGTHELERRYTISHNLIRPWIRKYEAGEFTDELANSARLAEYERKIAKLEVGQLSLEVDLLKKGARPERSESGANYSIVSGPGPSPSRNDADS